VIHTAPFGGFHPSPHHMPKLPSFPTSTAPQASSGYSIHRQRTADGVIWLGSQWNRLSCLHIHSEVCTGPMTKAEARSWLES